MRIVMIRDKFDIKLPDDFHDKVNQKILLTGAGFSKDFGALLANELWPLIFNDSEANYDLKHQMRTLEGNYEEIYSSLDVSAKKDFERILYYIFESFDPRVIKSSEENGEKIPDFMNMFQDKGKYSFIFTANQDLLVERCYISQTGNIKDLSGLCGEIADVVKLNFPYIDYDLTNIIRGSVNRCNAHNPAYSFEVMQKNIAFNRARSPVKDMMNYVKLHGSFNWQHSEGFVINVTGSKKKEDIVSTKILHSGISLFTEAAVTKKITLVIIGYSFGDQHINDIILKIINNDGRLVIISPTSWSDFSRQEFRFARDKERIKSKKILGAVDKYYQCTFKDFLGINCQNVRINDYYSNFKEYFESSMK